MSEEAEKTSIMKNLESSLKIVALLQSDFDKFVNKILPWKEYRDYQTIAETWDYLWENPEEYAEGGIGEIKNEDERIFRMGVAFGVEYERAYPSDDQENWPVDVEDR